MSTEARFLVKINSITTVGLVDCFFKNLKKENDELRALNSQLNVKGMNQKASLGPIAKWLIFLKTNPKSSPAGS